MLDIIPAVDVLDGKVVRLTRGAYDDVTVYASDPVAQAEAWMEEGAPLVHVVDLEGARSGAPDRGLWRRMASGGIRFQVGGGIRSAAIARDALDVGADRVVMGTTAVWEPEVLSAVGAPESVVAAIDVRDGRATGAGWLDHGRDLSDVLDGVAGAGVLRVLVTGISRDGTLEGPELDLTRTVVADGRFSVLASGGVGTLADLAEIAAVGCEGAIVGRALYERRFTVAEAIDVGGRPRH